MNVFLQIAFVICMSYSVCSVTVTITNNCANPVYYNGKILGSGTISPDNSAVANNAARKLDANTGSIQLTLSNSFNGFFYTKQAAWGSSATGQTQVQFTLNSAALDQANGNIYYINIGGGVSNAVSVTPDTTSDVCTASQVDVSAGTAGQAPEVVYSVGGFPVDTTTPDSITQKCSTATNYVIVFCPSPVSVDK